MGRWRNDFNDPPMQVVDDVAGSETQGQLVFRPTPRVVPHLGYIGVEPGGEILVPDEHDEHMAAGGWARVTTAPPAPAAPTLSPVAAVGSEQA